eukprot:2819933-Ditylum_brightwellii.AAC.1
MHSALVILDVPLNGPFAMDPDAIASGGTYVLTLQLKDGQDKVLDIVAQTCGCTVIYMDDEQVQVHHDGDGLGPARHAFKACHTCLVEV